MWYYRTCSMLQFKIFLKCKGLHRGVVSWKRQQSFNDIHFSEMDLYEILPGDTWFKIEYVRGLKKFSTWITSIYSQANGN